MTSVRIMGGMNVKIKRATLMRRVLMSSFFISGFWITSM